MEYNDLYIKYDTLTREKTNCQIALREIKHGYISTKTISGKKYNYLQSRVSGKLVSKYIKSGQLRKVRDDLDKRAELLERVKEIDEQLEKIEYAAGVLDNSLRRSLLTLRRCTMMETITLEERKKSLSFSSAISALEGIPTSKATERDLAQWETGKLSFFESYQRTLRKYHLTEA